MKHFIIAALLAAIGTVALVGNAHAASKYCKYNPDDPACYDQGGYGDDDGYGQPQPLYDDNQGMEDDGYYQEQRPKFRPVNRCAAIGQSLRRFGYRQIRPLDCSGKNLRFEAFRGYKRYILRVRASDGRIIFAVRG
jgi:hypothetical protein